MFQASVARTPNHQLAGGRIRELLEECFAAFPGLDGKLIGALGTSANIEDIPPDGLLPDLQSRLQLLMAQHGHPVPDIPADAPPTEISAALLHSWAAWAQDPASHTAAWLWHGAPAGISRDFELNGLLEAVQDEHPSSPDELTSLPLANYAGVDNDPVALEIIDGYVQQDG